MDITGFLENLPRKFIFLLIGLLIGLLAVVGFLLVNHQMHSGIIDQALTPADPEASLTIRHFQHNAVKEGRKQWSLSAAAASMYAKQNKVRLTEITAEFYLDDGRIVTLNADEGELEIDTDHITATGHVMVKMPGYSLKSESLQYMSEPNIIRSDQPVTVIAPSGHLTADTMTYHLDTKLLICEGDVKGTLHAAEKP